MLDALWYRIPSWSGREMKARKNYACAECGGIIPRGTYYIRDVLRQGPTKGRGPRKNEHSHHNCDTPWWQPGDNPRRLYHVGKLPHRAPTSTERDPAVPYQKPALLVHHARIGTMVWQLPPDLEARLGQCPDEARRTAAQGELSTALMMVLEALVESAGNQRKAQVLSHRLNALTLLS